MRGGDEHATARALDGGERGARERTATAAGLAHRHAGALPADPAQAGDVARLRRLATALTHPMGDERFLQVGDHRPLDP